MLLFGTDFAEAGFRTSDRGYAVTRISCLSLRNGVSHGHLSRPKNLTGIDRYTETAGDTTFSPEDVAQVIHRLIAAGVVLLRPLEPAP